LVSHITEEQRLRVSENREMRRKIEPMREEVTAGWRRLHNEELHNLCSSIKIISANKPKKMRWGM
jgi:hypothetical protein